MSVIELNGSEWRRLLATAQENLIGTSSSQIPIADKIIGNKRARLPSNIPEERGVYAIWVDGVAQYVGKAKKIRSRLRQHLIYRSEETGSKLEDVLKAKNAQKSISVSFIQFKPKELNEAIEQGLIGKLTGGVNNLLPWNTQGSNVNALEKWVKKKFGRSKKPIASDILFSVYDDEFYDLDDLDAVLNKLVRDGYLKKVKDSNNMLCYQRI